MPRVTRSSTQAKASDKPMAPTAVDLEIGRYQGKTVALEATPERLQASKNAPIPNLSERIHELTKENGQLRLEIKCLKEKVAALWDVKEDAEFAKETLDQTIVEFREVEKVIEGGWYQAMEGVHGA
jgi:regulator of replication initiation timing